MHYFEGYVYILSEAAFEVNVCLMDLLNEHIKLLLTTYYLQEAVGIQIYLREGYCTLDKKKRVKADSQ